MAGQVSCLAGSHSGWTLRHRVRLVQKAGNNRRQRQQFQLRAAVTRDSCSHSTVLELCHLGNKKGKSLLTMLAVPSLRSSIPVSLEICAMCASCSDHGCWTREGDSQFSLFLGFHRVFLRENLQMWGAVALWGATGREAPQRFKNTTTTWCSKPTSASLQRDGNQSVKEMMPCSPQP